VQLAGHTRFGTIAYTWPKHWAYHYDAATEAFNDLGKLHEELVRLPVGPDDMRTVSDIELLGRIYDAGVRLVVGVVLTVQHLCEEIERWTKTGPSGSTIEDRLAGPGVTDVVGTLKTQPGYAALHEIIERRDAVEHPREDNVYNGDDTGWDRVPLAWFISDRSLKAFETYQTWITESIEIWEEKKANWPQSPTTLEVGVRGVRSTHQFKKPARGEAES
jgi:hypothetical protein